MAVNWLESWLKNRWVQYSLRLAFALIITLLLSPFKLDLIEYTAFDLRSQITATKRTSGNVILIPIEYDTLKKLKRDPEALDWAVVLQKLGQAKPAHIVSTILPAQIQGSYDDLTFLAETGARLPFTIGQDDLPKTGLTHLDPLPPPFENLATEPFPKTADTRLGPKDGATRRLILTYENQFTLHPRLAQRFNGIHRAEDYTGVFPVLDSQQMLIRYREKGSYPEIKFIDILEGNFKPEQIRNKIVIIGKDNLESTVDYVTTPISKKLLALSQIEMHANVLDTLIMNQAPYFLPDWVKWALTFLISLLTITIVLNLRPGKGLLILGATLVAYLAASLALFVVLDWVVPLTHPLLAVFICYYFVIPYRLIIENRRSWEYYQKNKLLTQVEEMKSNFMRMMSHDLKTPLARIQGMAELIDKDAHNLTQAQRMAIETISDSSQELMEFIGSILSLSRISAKELKLQLRSRDVNQVLRNVIRRCEHLAAKKNIEIVAELEPLFSIKVDEDLIKTVLTNLVENAVKYSPENTKILITSEEVNNEIVVQVADQGRGIALEEINHIFERFYRARNSRTDTPGNGLGLFLAKYFVELHNGRIEVESEINKGSTFSVRLPMNLDLEPDHPEQSGGMYV